MLPPARPWAQETSAHIFLRIASAYAKVTGGRAVALNLQICRLRRGVGWQRGGSMRPRTYSSLSLLKKQKDFARGRKVKRREAAAVNNFGSKGYVSLSEMPFLPNRPEEVRLVP